MILTIVLAYKTRREHTIVCENTDTLTRICGERFGYEPELCEYHDRVCQEPYWGIQRMYSVDCVWNPVTRQWDITPLIAGVA